MFPCLYRPEQHEILPGGEILAWCKRLAPAKDRDRLFLYHHRIHDTFVIARWASPSKDFGIFTDFLHIGHSLAEFTKEKADEFRKRLFKPLQAHDMAKTINQCNRDYSSLRQEEDEVQKEWREERMKG